MSWDSYIDTLKGYSKDGAGAEHLDKACIIDGNSGAPWTSGAHAAALQLVGDEGAVIAREMKKEMESAFPVNGIRAAGVKYQFLRYDPDQKCAYGKKAEQGAITVQATKTAIVIGHCPEGKQHGNCNKAVASVVEYLSNQNM